MIRLSFLPPAIIYLIIAVQVLALVYLPLGVFVLMTVLSAMLIFIFRRSVVPFQDTFKLKYEIFLSPVFGKIVSIRQNVAAYGETVLGHEIKICITRISEKGLYLPTTGELTYLKATRGVKIPLNAEPHMFYGPMDEIAHTDFSLTSSRGLKSLMRFIDCPFGKRPKIWLKSGDRGRAAACFGYYPLGGTLLIYLPQNSDILVYMNEWVVPGKTVIASIKDIK